MDKPLEIVLLNPMDQKPRETKRKTGGDFTLRVNNYAMATTRLAIVILTNRMWFSVVCTLIDNDTRYHSGQKVVDSRSADVRANIFRSIDIFKILLQSDNDLLVCEMQKKKKKKKWGY